MPDEPAADASRIASVLARQFGIAEDEVPAFMADRFGARLAAGALAGGEAAWTDDSPLSVRERSLLVLAALVAQGGVDARLRAHVRLALANGLTADDLDAAVAFLAVYVGYPRATVAMEAVRDELASAEMR
jgi:4-carboxymuconolactone decarboxylase